MGWFLFYTRNVVNLPNYYSSQRYVIFYFTKNILIPLLNILSNIYKLVQSSDIYFGKYYSRPDKFRSIVSHHVFFPKAIGILLHFFPQIDFHFNKISIFQQIFNESPCIKKQNKIMRLKISPIGLKP